METPRQLTDGIDDAETPEELRGMLTAKLAPSLSQQVAKDYAEQIVMQHAFDTPQALLEMTHTELSSLGIPMGHRKRVARAIFAGDDRITESVAPAAAAAPPVGAPPEVNVTLTAPAATHKWKLVWPESCSPESLLDWGMTIRAHLIDKDEPFAELVWGRFTTAWTDVPHTHVDGNVLDVYLSKGLLSGVIPDWAAPLVRNHLQNWHGISAIQSVCRQVFVRTDLSDKELKMRVRYPPAETRASSVALRLAAWSSDLSVTVDVRNFTVDEHDKKEALKGMVEDLDQFKPALEQFENLPGGYTAAQLLKRLSEIADGIKSVPAAVQKKKKKDKAMSVKMSSKRTKEQKAAEAIAAVSRAVTKAGGFAKPRPRSKKAPGLCKYFRDNGNCRFGDKCIFSHGESTDGCADDNLFGVLSDLRDSDERDQMVAAVLRFWDGEADSVGALDLLLSVLEQAAATMTVTRTQMEDLMNDFDLVRPRVLPVGPVEVLVHQSDESGCSLAEPTIESVARELANKKPRKTYVRRRRVRHAFRASSRAAAAATDDNGNDDGLWDWLGDDDQHFVGVVGALADTGATGDFISSGDWAGAVNKRDMKPMNVHTGNGDTVVDKCGDLPGTGGLITGAPFLSACPETLLSVGKTCLVHGCGYTQDPGNTGARFWHPEYGAEGVLELEPDGVLFRLPEDVEAMPWADTRCNAIGDLTALLASKLPAWYQSHSDQGHPFRPDCDHCVRGRLRQRMARRIPVNERSREPGYIMSADFTGKCEDDVDGHSVALVACVHGYTDGPPMQREAAYGFVRLLVRRDTAAVAEALDSFEAELQYLGKDKGRAIVRFHTDVDKSFLGKVKKLAIRKGWKQTDTGGYRSQSNSIAERRIGMLKQTARTILLAATGASYYYDQLWGHSLMYSNYCLNRNNWSDTLAPYTQLTGKAYAWGKEDHAFGELCVYHVPKENREGQYQQPGELGLWMRREGASSHSAVVVPIKWDEKQSAWILQKTIVATTFKVYRGIYPLRMCPKEGTDPVVFDNWLDRAFDPLLHTAAEVDGGLLEEQVDPPTTDEAGYSTPDEASPEEDEESDGSAEYEVDRILNIKVVKGVRYYLVRWKGFSRANATWEPEASLCGCADALKDYEDGIRTAEAHPALLLSLDTDAAAYGAKCMAEHQSSTSCRALYARSVVSEFKAYLTGDDGTVGGKLAITKEEAVAAVEELMHKQKAQGTVDQWLDGYLKEYEAVKGMRLRELDESEAAQVRKEHLVPRLRMILEAKRDGRKKGRLILQGFAEPYSWDNGISSDSPVAYMSTIRCLLAMVRQDDVVTARDVSTAFLQSEGYSSSEGKRFVSYKTHKLGKTRYYELLGPLYGQRSASRRWFETISKWLTAPKGDGCGFVKCSASEAEPLLGCGFKQGKNEPCLFRDPDTGFTLVLYVDDILTAGSSEMTEKFHAALGEKFACKDQTYLADDSDLDFIGFSVTQQHLDGVRHIYLDQQCAMQQLLDSFDRSQLQWQASPMPTKQLFHSNPEPLDTNRAAQYRHFVGTLNYFSRATRFDISLATSRLSSKMSTPDVGSWKALTQLLGYLSGTVDFSIGGSVSTEDAFNFYADSDHAGDRQINSRSQTGYILFLNSFPVDWCSRRQPITAVSPAQAEIYAMHEAVVACRLIQWVAEEMGMAVKWPFSINTDSSQARSFQHNTCPGSKLRGCFDLRDKSVSELRDKGVVTSNKIHRDLNVADMLTHCLTRGQFHHHLDRAQNLRNHNSKGACVFSLIYSLELFNTK